MKKAFVCSYAGLEILALSPFNLILPFFIFTQCRFLAAFCVCVWQGVCYRLLYCLLCNVIYTHAHRTEIRIQCHKRQGHKGNSAWHYGQTKQMEKEGVGERDAAKSQKVRVWHK